MRRIQKTRSILCYEFDDFISRTFFFSPRIAVTD